MSYTISKLWHHARNDLGTAIDICLTRELAKDDSQVPITVFFRADDVAVPGKQYQELIQVFSRHQVPLSMAVVPTWLTRKRWKVIRQLCRTAPRLWCFYQHGWRHQNHEQAGKKQEFGPARPLGDIQHDLLRGRDRLAFLMGDVFYPAFTPPWNRCSKETLDFLKDSGYRAVSRSHGAHPPAPDGLRDYPINVDLHTRKDHSAAIGWQHLFEDLATAIAGRYCGIMIHHQRMNHNALVGLDTLLTRMCRMDRFHFYHLKDLVEERHEN